MSTRESASGVRESAWFKSSYSAGNGGDCVEVATATTSVLVRDSKRADGPILTVGSAEWDQFVRMAANA